MALLQVPPHFPVRCLQEAILLGYRLHLDNDFLLLSTIGIDNFIEVHDLIVHLPEFVGVLYFEPVDMSHMVAVPTHRPF